MTFRPASSGVWNPNSRKWKSDGDGKKGQFKNLGLPQATPILTSPEFPSGTPHHQRLDHSTRHRPSRPLPPSVDTPPRPTPLAHDQLTHMTPVEAHQHYSLVRTTISLTRGTHMVNLTTKTTRSPQNVPPLVDTPPRLPPLAHDQLAHMTPVEAHQYQSLIGTTVSRSRGACRMNLTPKTALSPQSVQISVDTAPRLTPLAHDRLSHMTPVEAHQHHSLMRTTVSRTRSACRANSTTRTAHSTPNVLGFPRPFNKCSSAGYAWKICLRTLSLVPILVDTHSVGSACADTFLLASRSTDSPYYALLALQVRVRVRASPAVRGCSPHPRQSSHSTE